MSVFDTPFAAETALHNDLKAPDPTDTPPLTSRNDSYDHPYDYNEGEDVQVDNDSRDADM